MEKFNLNFCKFEITSSLDSKEFFAELLRHRYSESEGWGFADVDLSGSLVTATLLKAITAYYRIWNAEVGGMERQYYDMVKEIRLYADFERNLLAIEGNRADLNKLKQVLRVLFWKKFLYDDLSVTPFGLLELISKDQYLRSIQEITISDFAYDNLFLGKYNAKPASSNVGIEEIMPYYDKLSKIKVQLCFGDGDVNMAINKAGTLTLECDEDVKYFLLSYLTSNLY